MTELENKCLYHATRLHEGVTYGGGMVMLDQVKGTTELVQKHSTLDNEDKEVAVCASLLHKCFETKRIAEGVSPLTPEQIKQIAGPKVLYVIQELMTETEDENKKAQDNPAAGQMQTMNKIMPLITVYFAFTFAAGIGFYWIANNVFRFLQQVIVTQIISKKKDPLVIEPKGKK